MQGRSHHGVVVVDQTVAKADSVDTQSALRVLHLVEHQPQLRGAFKDFLGRELCLVVVAELHLVPGIAYNVKVNGVVLSEQDCDTTEVRSNRVEVDDDLAPCVRYQLPAYQPRVVVAPVPGQEEHGTVNLRKVFLKSSVYCVIGFLGKQVRHVGVGGKIPLPHTCLCL